MAGTSRQSCANVSVENARPEAREFNENLHARLAKSVWNTGGCDSWFLDRTGANRQAWPGSSVTYWRHTRVPKRAWFQLRRTAPPVPPMVPEPAPAASR